MSKRLLFWLILFLTGIAFIIDLPRNFFINFNPPIGGGKFAINRQFNLPEINLNIGNFKFTRDLEIKKGLDLQGGTQLILEADTSNLSSEDKKTALESSREVVSRRIDLYGISESVIQTVESEGKQRLIVELPGVKKIDEAIALIGKTAQLDFRELPEDKKASPAAAMVFDFIPTGLNGSQLNKAAVQFDSQSGEPVVSLEFNSDGTALFSEITQRNVGQRVAIFLDEIPITAPTVNEPITSGNAVISGGFALKEAKNLAIQLNAGALPVPLKVVEQKNIGAILGEISVKKSINAGLIGLLLVTFFMIFLYGFLGFLAIMGLIIYGLISLAIYKIIPVTLTLPGMAGFILSVGMAVDANILIFERIKEERWLGKPLKTAMELGFGRAWDSIKDANVCTLITAFILFNPFNWGFLNTSGMVRGFAFTLALGIFISLFTGIIVTRNLIRLFYQPKEAK